MLLAALQLLQPRDDLPHIRACGQARRGGHQPVPEDDSGSHLIGSLLLFSPPFPPLLLPPPPPPPSSLPSPPPPPPIIS